VREVYEACKVIRTDLTKQLYWRDFYMLIMYHYPHVINNNMNHYKIKWVTNAKLLKKWQNGLTGYPIIDAGMRQLNKTGWMHNRPRMCVSSFLAKIMHIDWQEGEKYFAKKLVDYDPANNNGGWQWSAGTGTDSQPYFRYFNPFSQSRTYDPDAIYIKTWIPELRDVLPKDIHKWNETYKNYKVNYPKPLYDDLGKQMKETIKMYSHH
jgi:deoxyribodipyrimidine photo-lyase